MIAEHRWVDSGGTERQVVRLQEGVVGVVGQLGKGLLSMPYESGEEILRLAADLKAKDRRVLELTEALERIATIEPLAPTEVNYAKDFYKAQAIAKEALDAPPSCGETEDGE